MRLRESTRETLCTPTWSERDIYMPFYGLYFEWRGLSMKKTWYVIHDGDENKFQWWWKETGAWLKDAGQTVIENKEVILLLAPVALGGLKVLTKIVKSYRQTNNIRKLKNIKELYIYDNRLGAYYKLKRALSNDELLYVDRCRRAGESLGNILKNMNILK